ncbi:MAG: hypothetical protein M1541_07895, partial [Acidobacteria bacterium]|nr:hypothetical protein [Acidobacteriota bacterium]
MTEIVWVNGIVAATALAATFACIRRWRRMKAAPRNLTRKPDGAGPAEENAPPAFPDLTELLRHTLRRDLELAAQHVHSLRWLLEIARQHQQPIPTSALTNLDLVSKHLGEMQRRIAIAGEETTAGSTISAIAHHREIQSPLHPRPPSFGCRVSPSDIST